jgi:subtilisin family serine protease
VVAPDLAAPPVTPGSPVLALIDSPLDASHPEFAGGNVTGLPGPAVNDFHGTATAAVAAAPANGTGILGVWPGMRAVNLPLPSEISCTDSARQIAEAVRRRVSVINMSYSASRPCFAEYEQLQRATASGVALVAAAGNEFEAGNEPQYPASLPHVVTVTAVGADLRSSYFSNANAAVDLAAPGEGILTAVPLDHDPDDTRFAAPMVAAALTWVRAARPRLSVDQAVQVVRLSARDLDREGYDANTGFGLLQVGAALTAPAPARDPGEPNEDIRWIDGSRVRGNERPLYRSGRSATVTAVADRYEDPRDVYRVVVPARGRLALELRPRFGDVDLFAHDLRASTVAGRRYRLGASTRDGTRTDTLTIANRTAVARTAWVTVAIDDGARALDARYRLRVTRR